MADPTIGAAFRAVNAADTACDACGTRPATWAAPNGAACDAHLAWLIGAAELDTSMIVTYGEGSHHAARRVLASYVDWMVTVFSIHGVYHGLLESVVDEGIYLTLTDADIDLTGETMGVEWSDLNWIHVY